MWFCLFHHEFFLPSSAGDAVFAPLVVDATGRFCSFLDPSANKSIALIASLNSKTAAAQAVCHDTMLTLPSGARGNDSTHST